MTLRPKPLRLHKTLVLIAIAFCMLIAGCDPSEEQAPRIGTFEGLTWEQVDDQLTVRRNNDTPHIFVTANGSGLLDAPMQVAIPTSFYAVQAVGGLAQVPCDAGADCVPPIPCPTSICPPDSTVLPPSGASSESLPFVTWDVPQDSDPGNNSPGGTGVINCASPFGFCLIATEAGGVVIGAGALQQLPTPLGLFLANPVLALNPSNVPCISDADCVPPPPCVPSGICPPDIKPALSSALGW